MFQTSILEKFNTHVFFSENRVPFMSQCGKNRSSRTGHRRQYNAAHALCIRSNQGCRHTLRICNIYCFFTATMVTRTRLNVTLYVNCMSLYCSNCQSCGKIRVFLCSMDRASYNTAIIIQQDATEYSLFKSVSCSTCFG